MEKSCHSSSSIATTSNGQNAGAAATTSSPLAMQSAVRALNKSSHKISKPIIAKHNHHHLSPTPPNPPATTTPQTHTPLPDAAAPPPPPPPPVYNIDKNDFRDVVQRLTGSPAHHNTRTPPSSPATPSPPTKPIPTTAMGTGNGSTTTTTSTRLQKIRPPPLASLVGPRTSPLGGIGAATVATTGPSIAAYASGAGNAWMRPWTATPLSPLPPLPTVSAAAESPISAYMRRLHGGGGQPPSTIPSSPGSIGAQLCPFPSSPLGFGCLPSPRSAYQMTLPPSPKMPMPSPRWKDP